MSKNNPSFISHGGVAVNRKARFEYHIEQTFEAGIALWGTEVKAIRMGIVSMSDAYVAFKQQQLTLVNLHIGSYPNAPLKNQHSPKRYRNLLLHRRELNKCYSAVNKQGLTIIPLAVYFNKKGRAKVEIAIAKGKKLHDKRHDIKKREWERKQASIMKNAGRD